MKLYALVLGLETAERDDLLKLIKTPELEYLESALMELNPETPRRWEIMAETLNVRAGPNTNAAVTGRVTRGEIVTQLEENTAWVRHTGGGGGWSAKAYMRLAAS